MFRVFYVACVSLLLLLHQVGGMVVDLTPSTLDSTVNDKKKNIFLLFYDPWQPSYLKIKPLVDEFGSYFEETGPTIIARYNGNFFPKDAARYNVTSFPTMRLYPKNDKSGKLEYKGPHDFTAYENFLDDHLPPEPMPDGTPRKVRRRTRRKEEKYIKLQRKLAGEEPEISEYVEEMKPYEKKKKVWSWLRSIERRVDSYIPLPEEG